MSASRVLYLNTRGRRKALTYIFGATAAASVLTVAGSDVLPCPARPKGTSRYAEGSERMEETVGKPIVEKRPRRWIEEKNPS
ncbi:hypothetical protein BDW22DRAFT_1350986 [Trametopsis cervina]|nr:hypothetical protein BDW22DRAFT_1350986 [Trametopsis cervina]